MTYDIDDIESNGIDQLFAKWLSTSSSYDIIF